MARLAFEARYYGDRLQVVNPHGDVGVVTLWSDPTKVRARFDEAGSPVFAPSGRVAVIANLYGNGMYAMFCNLLFNPQIRHLVAVGLDRGLPVGDEIEAFFAHGTEPDELLGVPARRVRGTARVLPAKAAFDEERLRERVTFHRLGRMDADVVGRVTEALAQLPPAVDDGAPRVEVDLELGIGADHVVLPSQTHAHQVVRARPLAAWKELVVRTARFGLPVELGPGEQRLELRDAKAVITDPVREDAAVLRRYGFELDDLVAYEAKLLRDDVPDEVGYTYGNRLFGYFDQGDGSCDSLASVVERLRANPGTRSAYVSLWDTGRDLPPGRAVATPCLATIYFRRSVDRLTLTATFRVHNLLTAWLRNVYGLMAVQRHVAEQVGMEPGTLTVVSHSLGLDPAEPGFDRAEALAERWVTDEDYDEVAERYELPQDPNGSFVVSTDRERGEVVAEHWAPEGVLIKRYAGTHIDRIARAIAGDMAVTLPSHALWLGRELARHEAELAASGDAGTDQES